MGTLSKILFIVLAIFIIWQLFAVIRRNPQMFSKDNLGRSFFTLGILALILIGFIALLVYFVKNS